jgi:hypothetical protein
LVLAAGGCGRPLGETGGLPPTGGVSRRDASPSPADAGASLPDASPPLADGGGQLGRDGGARPAGDGGDPSVVPATVGSIVAPEIAPYTKDVCASQAPGGWCWVEPRPQGLYLSDLSSPVTGELWAVGAEGTVLHGLASQFQRVVWTLADVGVTADLTAVSASGDGAVFVGSASGDVVRGYASGGWTKLSPPGLAKVTGLWAPSANEVWAVGNEPTVYHWVRATGWTAADAGPDGAAAVVGRGASDVWMASELGHSLHWDGTALTSGDIAVQGRSTYPWDARYDLYFRHLGILDDGTIWAAASSNSLTGTCWALSGGAWSPANAYTIAGASLAQHWAAGAAGHAIFVSPYGPDASNETFLGDGAVLGGRAGDLWAIAGRAARHGAFSSWDPPTSLFYEPYYAHVVPNGDVWLTGMSPSWQSQAARWDGAQWSLFTLPTENGGPVVAANGPDVWLGNLSLWHWSGGVLEELPFPTSASFPTVAPWYGRRLFAVPGAVWILGTDPLGGSTALLRTDGRTWRLVPLPWAGFRVNPDGGALRGTSDHDLWLVSGLAVFHYDGQAWSEQVLLPGSGQYSIRDLAPLGPDDVWAGLFHFDGTSWTATAPPDSFGDIDAMWAGADDDVWAMTSTGLRHFDGQAWSLTPVPLASRDAWVGLSAVSSRDLWISGFDGIIHGTPPAPAPSP